MYFHICAHIPSASNREKQRETPEREKNITSFGPIFLEPLFCWTQRNVLPLQSSGPAGSSCPRLLLGAVAWENREEEKNEGFPPLSECQEFSFLLPEPELQGISWLSVSAWCLLAMCWVQSWGILEEKVMVNSLALRWYLNSDLP